MGGRTRTRSAAALAVVLLLSGCGDDDDSRPPRTATATFTTAATPPTLTPTAVPHTPTAAPTASLSTVPSATATRTGTTAPSPTPTASAPPAATATLPPAVLHGRTTDASGAPLAGAMVTAFDDPHAASVTVFTDIHGRYDFPVLTPGSYRLRARRIGWNDAIREAVSVTADGGNADFSLAAADDVNAQLPASYFKSLLHWPNERVAGDFARACANCHQIGDHRWRKPRIRAEWEQVVNRMIAYGGVPFFAETRAVLVDTLAETFAPEVPAPQFAVPPPPSGDAVRAVIYEWEIDPTRRPGCHDLELGLDGVVYMVPGVRTLDPRTFERGHLPIQAGGHSIERDGVGNMWITAPGPEEIIRLDVTTGALSRFPQPRIGEDLGSYPHTLAFDDSGRIWYTLTRSNHVGRFDPDTAQFTYYQLPPADPETSGVPIAVAYGCDVAPDQSVWWSQLFGHAIGRVDPLTGEVQSWRPPFDGPRRLFAGADNTVWVPGYGSGELGHFDPVSETWTVYALPTEPAGHELPYDVSVDRASGDVWITGSNSDTLIRLRPATEEFTVFPLPTAVDFTREIEFGPDGGVWTCTSDQEIAPGVPGSGRLIKLLVRDPIGSCGDGIAQLGEGCDDGNAADCDGCSAGCTVETGCGDGVRCGAEACDDGNRAACDGCGLTCLIEVGSVCGDGTANAACGEECDPPGPLCTAQCQRVPLCGDGFTSAGEACDDGNLSDCDGCSASCALESGCGDGVRCGAETCDDGNLLACDGCSPACAVEIGAECGDGMVNESCGEECDPPGDDCSLICTFGDGGLGTRTLTFGGAFFSSALGTTVPLGSLQGSIELIAGAIGDGGLAPLQVSGPIFYGAPILEGQFGTFCVRIDSCTGLIDCDGGTPVDTLMVQDSNGAGLNGLPVTITTGLGDAAPAGAVQLDCQQSFVQLEPGEGSDCATAAYPAPSRIIYTTGTAEAFFLNGNPKVGTGRIRFGGEPFSCSAWRTTDGPGQLAGTFLVEEERRAGDTANLALIDD